MEPEDPEDAGLSWRELLTRSQRLLFVLSWWTEVALYLLGLLYCFLGVAIIADVPKLQYCVRSIGCRRKRKIMTSPVSLAFCNLDSRSCLTKKRAIQRIFRYSC